VQDGLRPGISRGFPDKPDSRKQAADAGNEQETFFEEASPNSPENGKSGALLLLKGLDDPRMGKYLCAELGELLFPDERTIRKADIKNELSACARL
jgi:hypothetical protein